MHPLVYRDISGKPRLRRFVSVAICIFAGSLLLSLWTFRPQKNRPEYAFPVSVANNLFTRERVLEAFGTTPADEPALSACPEDPQDWRLEEIFPGDNYKRIEPGCVYEGIASTAAWMLLERMGYSKPEAVQQLRLPGMPWSPTDSAITYTNFQGPLEMNLFLDWPAHPEFFFWQLDREGRAASVITLRGCFYLENTVHCVLALDRMPGSAVSILEDYRITSHAADKPGSRNFYLIEYQGGGLWYLKGQIADQTVLLEESEKISEERRTISSRLGVVPWDASWLASAFGVTMKPLPENWRIFGMEQSAVDGISVELNRFLGVQDGAGDDQ